MHNPLPSGYLDSRLHPVQAHRGAVLIGRRGALLLLTQ